MDMKYLLKIRYKKMNINNTTSEYGKSRFVIASMLNLRAWQGKYLLITTTPLSPAVSVPITVITGIRAFLRAIRSF